MLRPVMLVFLAWVAMWMPALVYGQPATPGGIRLQDEGTTQAANVQTLNCVGTGVSCSAAGTRGTLTVSGGGTFSGIGACGDSMWAHTLNDNAAPTCSSIYFSDLVGTAALTQLTDDATSGLCLLSGGTGGDPAWTTCPGGGAPTGASYWTRVAEAGLSNETALGALGSGLVLNTTTTGVPTIYGGTSCTNQFPRSLNASGAATCASVASADLNITASSCTNQFLTAISSSGAGTCTSPTLAGAQYANQGTTTTVLHGNAAGNPSWAAVSMSNDVTGTLGVGNGGTGQASNWTQGGVLYGSSTTATASSAAGSAGQCLLSGGTGAPTWGACASGSGTTLQVTGSDVTNSTTSPVTIFSTSVANATQYGFLCELVAQGTATSLPRYNVNGPTANNVSFETRRFTTTSAQTLLVLQTFSGSAQTTACTTSCNATNLPTYIAGSFTTTASGTLSFQVTSSTSGQTVTVRRGSFCRVF